MKPSDLIDEAELRHEFRTMYREHGYEGALKFLHEMLFGAQILVEVIIEEQLREEKH